MKRGRERGPRGSSMCSSGWVVEAGDKRPPTECCSARWASVLFEVGKVALASLRRGPDMPIPNALQPAAQAAGVVVIPAEGRGGLAGGGQDGGEAEIVGKKV